MNAALEAVREKIGEAQLDGKPLFEQVKAWHETHSEVEKNIDELRAMRKAQEEEDRRRNEEREQRKRLMREGNLSQQRSAFREEL
jgi:hypothetical protein